MAAGYISYEAFWIGGASGGATVLVITPPDDTASTGGGSTSFPRAHPLIHSKITVEDLRIRQAANEDSDLIQMVIAILGC